MGTLHFLFSFETIAKDAEMLSFGANDLVKKKKKTGVCDRIEWLTNILKLIFSNCLFPL